VRYIAGFLVALALFASTAAAAPPTSLQLGFVCNSERAVERMRPQMRELIEAGVKDPDVLVAMSVRRISTPRDWCIEGFVKETRPSQELYDPHIASMEILASVMGIVPHIGGFISRGMLQDVSAMPRTHSYKTERGRTMFFAGPQQRTVLKTTRKYDRALDQLIEDTVRTHLDDRTLDAAITKAIREYHAKDK
jgi:hypothetical protein